MPKKGKPGRSQRPLSKRQYSHWQMLKRRQVIILAGGILAVVAVVAVLVLLGWQGFVGAFNSLAMTETTENLRLPIYFFRFVLAVGISFAVVTLLKTIVQSLAEARLPAGGSTQEHFHARTEEIYFITAGTGRIRIEDEVRDVKPGDAVAILPGKRHKLWNTGDEPLTLLCCCAPAYEHSDTVLTEK